MSISYELAKQLKDSGFPQNQALEELGGNKKWIPEYKEWIDIPTLSELIEACGENFNNLCRISGKDKWVAYAWTKEEELGYGSTPEIAVARLWISLQG